MTLLQAALFAVLVAALLGIAWWSVSDYAEAQLRANVKTEMASLLQAAADGTLDRQIQQRVAVMPIGPDYYLLADASGQRISGNLRYRPTVAGWQTVPLQGALGEDNTDADEVHLYATRLPDGRWLIAGSDNRSVVELSELLSTRFLEIGVSALLLVLLTGGISGWLYMRRIDALGELAEKALEGEADFVAPRSGKDDEFDRLADRFRRMLARMHVLMDGMRQVSNDIAHDLRTPLMRMRQRLEAGSDPRTDEAGLRDSVQRALAEVDELLATFRALLRIANVESRQRRSGFEELDLSALFDALAETYRPVAEDLGQQLSAHIDAGQHLRGDQALLTQMLANLIENALHHTPTGSRIHLDLHSDANRMIGRITDSGPGIPTHDRERVLKRFVRLDTSRSTPGSGLGLALVSAVADLHGIQLSLGDAQPGLVVELSFPLAA